MRLCLPENHSEAKKAEISAVRWLHWKTKSSEKRMLLFSVFMHMYVAMATTTLATTITRALFLFLGILFLLFQKLCDSNVYWILHILSRSPIMFIRQLPIQVVIQRKMTKLHSNRLALLFQLFFPSSLCWLLAFVDIITSKNHYCLFLYASLN